MKNFLKLFYYLIPIFLVVLIVSIADTSISKSDQVQKRPPLSDLWGVTCEDILDDTEYTPQVLMDSLVLSISKLRCDVTTRIVYNSDDANGDPYTPNPEWYDSVTHQIKSVSKVMGLFLDSYSWSSNEGLNFGREQLISRLDTFMSKTSLIQDVDIWEIGNESNGGWVHDGGFAEVQSDLDTLYKIAKAKLSSTRSKRTALTLFFYPSEECVDNDYGNYSGNPEDYMMLHWATTFVNNYPDVINNIDYVLISYYHREFLGCDTTSIEGWFWYNQVDSLTRLFPNSIIGFGEIGWPDTSIADNLKTEIVNTYYPWTPPNMVAGYPWTHAGFLWNYQTDNDCFDQNNYSFSNKPVWKAVDSIMGECNRGNFNRNEYNLNSTFDNKTKLDYSLSNNYPNPFNPVTRINFAIPKQGFVSLKIYDVLGREVRTLVNEVKSAGQFSVEFNASEFASGVYFYRLESNGFSDIKKMMLLK